MNLTIDKGSKQPPSQQLKLQLIEQIMSRRLPEGTKLSSVRALATDLGLAAGTAARVYRELEEEGYLITRGRLGTFVAPIAPPDEAALAEAREMAADYVASARGLGLGDEAIASLVNEAL